MKPRVLLVDNHDSFTWNLARLLDETRLCTLSVRYNDQLEIREVKESDKVVFSPGPGVPSEFPQMKEILSAYMRNKSILGICLGHQAIVEAMGGALFQLKKVVHGTRQQIQLTEPVDTLFEGLPRTFHAGLYHSWAADPDSLPVSMHVTAIGPGGIIMGTAHNSFDIRGVQFHPESYMTEYGHQMMVNWLKY